MSDTPSISKAPRRRFLGAAGLVGLGLLAGCSTRGHPATAVEPTTDDTASPTETRTATPEAYDRVVDIVDAGADPNGEQSVVPVVEEAVGDDTLVRFPPGRYRFGSPLRIEGYSNLGLVGEEATFLPGEDLRYWLIAQEVPEFTLAGVTLDHRGEGVGPQVQVHTTEGLSILRDLTVRGFHDSDNIPLIPNVESPDGALRVERLRIPDGTQGVPAVFVGPKSVGKLTFQDCYLAGCAQGIYASPHSGPFYALGGTYVNNNKGAIRVGAADHGAHIEGVHVRIDGPDVDRWTNRTNLRGLWLREGNGTFVSDCDIELLDLSGVVSDGAIFLDDTMGVATIQNTRIRVDPRTYAVRAQHPSGDEESLQGDEDLPEEYHLTCEDVSISGRAAAGDAIRVMGRDGSLFRNVVVDQPHGQRRGLVVGGDATGCTVHGGSWVTGHYPFVVAGHREQLTGHTCPVRLAGVETLRAANTDGETLLAAGNGDSYCVGGVAGVPDAREVVVAVSGVRRDGLYGTRMSAKAFEKAYASWL